MAITVTSNFTVNTALPIDDRLVVADLTARDSLASGRRYEGLAVYVVSNGKTYRLVGGILDANWAEQSGFALGLETDSTSTGVNAVLGSFTTILKKVSNSFLTSIGAMSAPSGVQIGVVVNGSGHDITIINEESSLTAANRILTGTGADLVVKSGASIWLAYDTGSSRWRVIGGSGGGGSARVVLGTLAAPVTITNGNGFAPAYDSLDLSAENQTIYCKGNTPDGIEKLTSGTIIYQHPIMGSEVTLFGASDADQIQIEPSSLLRINGTIVLRKGTTITLISDGVISSVDQGYTEKSRNGL